MENVNKIVHLEDLIMVLLTYVLLIVQNPIMDSRIPQITYVFYSVHLESMLKVFYVNLVAPSHLLQTQ